MTPCQRITEDPYGPAILIINEMAIWVPVLSLISLLAFRVHAQVTGCFGPNGEQGICIDPYQYDCPGLWVMDRFRSCSRTVRVCYKPC
jgi:hypothetical protein